MPATIQAHMPAIEIAFGETFRAASHAVAACAHFRLRVAIGRRSIALLVVSSIIDWTESIAGQRENAQDKMSILVLSRFPSCHSERGEESLIISSTAHQSKRQRYFASLNSPQD